MRARRKALHLNATMTAEAAGISRTAKCTAQTGVEMEALSAVSVALLTIDDLCKPVERSMTMYVGGDWWKSGGRALVEPVYFNEVNDLKRAGVDKGRPVCFSTDDWVNANVIGF